MHPAVNLLLLAALVAATPALAKSSDRQQPMDISADSTDAVMEDNGMSVLKGNVSIRQGTLEVNADRAEVHRTIYDELCRGEVLDESHRTHLAIIERLRARGAEGIILGCTELELLLDPDADGSVPLFATTRIHARAAVDAALA